MIALEKIILHLCGNRMYVLLNSVKNTSKQSDVLNFLSHTHYDSINFKRCDIAAGLKAK